MVNLCLSIILALYNANCQAIKKKKKKKKHKNVTCIRMACNACAPCDMIAYYVYGQL